MYRGDYENKHSGSSMFEDEESNMLQPEQNDGFDFISDEGTKMGADNYVPASLFL